MAESGWAQQFNGVAEKHKVWNFFDPQPFVNVQILLDDKSMYFL